MRYFLSIFFMLLFAFNSISLILPYTDLYADVEVSITPENKTEQEPKEERTDPESKEKFQPYSIVINNIVLHTHARKNKTAYSNPAFIEEVNIKNPTPPPEQA
jgi:anionic cell wall polymer biosynthesis LytR-Cps2A-Psr (LCP) family protein